MPGKQSWVAPSPRLPAGGFPSSCHAWVSRSTCSTACQDRGTSYPGLRFQSQRKPCLQYQLPLTTAGRCHRGLCVSSLSPHMAAHSWCFCGAAGDQLCACGQQGASWKDVDGQDTLSTQRSAEDLCDQAWGGVPAHPAGGQLCSGILPFSSVLTLSTWEYCRVPRVEA